MPVSFYEILYIHSCGGRKWAYLKYAHIGDIQTDRDHIYICIFTPHAVTANTNYFRDEEMKCYFWRKGWSFIRIVQKMTQPATHSDLKAFKCCFVSMLTSIQSSSSEIEWASLSPQSRLHQPCCPGTLPVSADRAQDTSEGINLGFSKLAGQLHF